MPGSRDISTSCRSQIAALLKGAGSRVETDRARCGAPCASLSSAGPCEAERIPRRVRKRVWSVFVIGDPGHDHGMMAIAMISRDDTHIAIMHVHAELLARLLSCSPDTKTSLPLVAILNSNRFRKPRFLFKITWHQRPQ